MRDEDGISITRNPVPADALSAIMPVMLDAFDPQYGEAWNQQQVLGMLVSPLCHVLIAHDQNKKPIGFAMSRRTTGEEELLLIAVKKQCRGRGIGRILMENLIVNAINAKVETIFLEMRSDNDAVNLYSVFNFHIVGTRKNYYTGIDGKRFDAVTYALSIGK